MHVDAKSGPGGVLPEQFPGILNICALTAFVPAISAGSLVAAFAKCMVSYLRDRKKRITIQTAANKMTITAENYTEENLLRVLDRLQRRVNLILSDDPVLR